jgi:thioredoxin-like negative regulator of GroEL
MIRDAIASRDLPLYVKAIYDSTLADVKQFSRDTNGARIAWQQVRDEAESLRQQANGERLALAAAYAALGDQRKALAIVDQMPGRCNQCRRLGLSQSENRCLCWE